ncbi:hypothetical protein CSUB8523_1714 [Campylobacter subantarcticus LMG 24377]|uniref:Periplasmic protein n=2 Tax=Campylobacter subantarcticus TaxID=497724 RepID=A0A0A8HCR0_9BACT|nr:hypothetical protein [Campylobacter subantarcticus]EAJ1260971.1 hypothetical protein [Campylobacter lari]AJC91435.1 hypothetical protein CSUB8521_1618 [Campylobacter subantarcticus LMG 24374]AJC93202.1 hypothetical protein CSUB8523_1714 [Campylobacter subantarcticus LMG 24377]EAJ1262117.1 hypothetical protein [Campylobacter lari]EAL3938772.1 hypothetical protein [Campylobacter lari]
MGSDLLLWLVVALLIFAMFAYMMIKEKENIAKINELGKMIEDLNKQYHYLKKESLDEQEQEKEEIDAEAIKEELKEELLQVLEQKINQNILPILNALKEVEEVIEEFQSEQKNRLLNLEQKTQSITKLSPSYDNEEQKVIELFNQKKSIEQIAKDLRIGMGRVELILKFNKLL